MSESSARHGLPLLVAGQGQKDVTHNEAMILVDALLHPCIESLGRDEPPASPTLGQAWLLGDAPVGAWTGQGGALAVWTAGGWRFANPSAGTVLVDRATGRRHALGDAGWEEMLPRPVPPLAIAAPDSGAVIDVEARDVLRSLIERFRALGFLS
jgi:hypothetical protein